MQTYHLNATQFGNLTAFYYYAYTPMQIVVGVFMDRYGPRLLVTLACLACAIGTYLFAFSDILLIAQIGRFMVGFGSAFAFVGALKLATIWLPPERFALVAGSIVALGNLGAMAGDILLTSLVRIQGWQQTNMLSAVIGIGLAVLIVLIVRDGSRKVSPHTLNVKFSTVFAALFQTLKKRQIWLNGLVGCLLYMPTTVFAELWGIPYLEQAHGFSSHDAATIVSMVFLGWVFGCPLAGFISDLVKRRILPMMIGSIVALVAIGYILYMPDFSKHMAMLAFFFLGLFACVQVLVFAVGRESSSHHIAGTAIALTNMFVMLGGLLFQPIVGWLLDRNWNGEMLDGVRIYSPENFQSALIVLPLGLIAAFVIMFFLRETRCQLQAD
jgi:MFS family permease